MTIKDWNKRDIGLTISGDKIENFTIEMSPNDIQKLLRTIDDMTCAEIVIGWLESCDRSAFIMVKKWIKE